MNEQAIWLVIGAAFFLGNAMLFTVAVLDWRENRRERKAFARPYLLDAGARPWADYCRTDPITEADASGFGNVLYFDRELEVPPDEYPGVRL